MAMKKILFLALVALLLPTSRLASQNKEADSLYNKSKTFWYNNKDSALHYLTLTLRVSQANRYLKGEANALKGFGFFSESRAERLQYYIQAIEIRRQLKDTLGIGVSLHDIGTVYRDIGDTEKMFDYYTRSLALKKRINDYGGIALTLIVLGNFEISKGDYAKGLSIFKESLSYRIKAGDINGVAYSHINIANAHLLLKHYDSAVFFSDLAQQEFAKAKNNTTLDWIIWIQSKCYFDMGKQDKALQLLKKQNGSLDEYSQKCLLLRSEIHEQRKEFEQALYFHKTWSDKNSEFEKLASQKAAGELAADYEFKLKQAEITALEQEQKLMRKRQDNLQFMLIAIGLIGIFTFTFSVRKQFSARAIHILVFIGSMLLFEFLVVLIDPSLQEISGNKPVFLLLGNTVIALVIAPLHHVMEKYFKKRLATVHNLI